MARCNQRSYANFSLQSFEWWGGLALSMQVANDHRKARMTCCAPMFAVTRMITAVTGVDTVGR
jgi:hypothetical protein